MMGCHHFLVRFWSWIGRTAAKRKAVGPHLYLYLVGKGAYLMLRLSPDHYGTLLYMSNRELIEAGIML